MLHTSKNNVDRLAHKTEATFRPVAAIIVIYRYIIYIYIYKISKERGEYNRVLSCLIVGANARHKGRENYVLRVPKSTEIPGLVNKKGSYRVKYRMKERGEGDGTLAISILERINSCTFPPLPPRRSVLRLRFCRFPCPFSPFPLGALADPSLSTTVIAVKRTIQSELYQCTSSI